MMKRLYVCPSLQEMPWDCSYVLVGSNLKITSGGNGTKDDDVESKRNSTVWDEWDLPDYERTAE